MKFKFCWDTDCPDWLLAEIAALSNLTSVKLKLLVAHVANSILGENLDVEKIIKWTGDQDADKCEACIGGIKWIIEKAAGAQVASNTLESELLQLGLPKEHAAAFAKVYSEHLSALRSKLCENTGINCLGGKLNTSVSVKGLKVAESVEPVAQLTFYETTTGLSKQTTYQKKICLSADQVKVLLHDLHEAKSLMSSLAN